MVKLISTEDFETSVKIGEVDIILDTRRINEFNEEHIPGAIHMPWEDWNEPAPDAASDILHEPGYWGKLADPEAHNVAEKLTAQGIHNDARIVIYADGYRSRGREGRIAWMLLYFGATNVSILNGGFRAWQKSARAGIPHPAQPATGKHFELSLDPRRRVTKDDVKAQMHKSLLVDTRGGPEFAGLEYDYQPRLGHIPQAINVPFRRLLHANGLFINKADYMEIAAKHALNADCVWYCEVGVRAAMFSLLHEIYTGAVTPVYDGSFMEWAWDETLPVDATASTPA